MAQRKKASLERPSDHVARAHGNLTIFMIAPFFFFFLCGMDPCDACRAAGEARQLCGSGRGSREAEKHTRLGFSLFGWVLFSVFGDFGVR